MNVALFGFMGVGKSAVGRIVAERLGLAFTDLDDKVVKQAGKPIPAIFEEEGEAAFRELERDAVKEASDRDGQVIACGGGAVLDEENLRHLRRNSVMILLTADAETILRRVEYDGGLRPILDTDDKLERIRDLLSARRDSYIKSADIVVDASDRTPEQVADQIIRCLRGVMRI